MARDNTRTLQECKGKFSLFLSADVIKGIGWAKGDKIRIDIGGRNKLELSRVEEPKKIT